MVYMSVNRGDIYEFDKTTSECPPARKKLIRSCSTRGESENHYARLIPGHKT